MVSEVGRGSSFWFTVKAPAVDLRALQLDVPLPDQTADADLPALRILIVDDVPVNRHLVTALLSPFNAVISEAASGQEAIDASLNEQFDIILMDLQMPGMDGISATRAIRATSALNRTTPVLAFSANVLPVHVEACRAAGMNDHIAKPIQPESFLTKILFWGEHVQMHRMRQAV